MSVSQVKKTIDEAEEYIPEPARPLMREIPSPERFPIECLGDVLGPAAEAIHDKIQAPLAICAQSVLAGATLATQGHANVELPTGQTKPISNFFITVAESGDRKSSSDREALWPIRKREESLRQAYDLDLEVYNNDKDAYEKQKQQIFGEKKKYPDRKGKAQALKELGPAPQPPLKPMLTCPEPTFEGLCNLLAVGEPSVGIFSSEGGQFIGGYGMSKEHKLKTASALSDAWDGEPIRRVRVKDGAMILPGRRVSLHLMAQPDVASIMLADPELIDQGLLSRMLVSAPDSTAGTRFWQEPSVESEASLKRYWARLLEILEAPLPLVAGKQNELAPRTLTLSEQGRITWIRFADHIEGMLSPGGEMEPIKGLANKLPEHAARIAAVLTLIKDLQATQVSDEALKQAIVIVQHFAGEALRLFGIASINAELKLAQKTLDWILGKWKEEFISLPDIYQFGPNPIRDKDTACKVAGILEGHGSLIPCDDGAVVSGHHRSQAWRVRRG